MSRRYHRQAKAYWPAQFVRLGAIGLTTAQGHALTTASFAQAVALFLGFVVWSMSQVAPNQRDAQSQTEPAQSPRTQ